MKILFVQPSLNPPGGGNLVACWMLEALRDEHALTVLAYRTPDLAACNRFYGTSLRTADFALQLAPALVRRLGDLSPLPLCLLKDSYLFRRAAQRAGDYDLVITANNEGDLGGRGLQYVHFPRLDVDRPIGELRWYHGPLALRRAYHRACRGLARQSRLGLAGNRTLTNSAFIGTRVQRVHGIATTVLHPPAPGAFSDTPWSRRENGMVALGRFAPEKRIEQIIGIAAAVRARHADVHLYLVGTPGPEAYTRDVRRWVRERAAWVSLRENLSRAELLALLARQRYGIHAMPDEHFGIAVADLVRAGCIVFVPDTGGPREIVGDRGPLLFSSPADAVANIVRTIGDTALQAELRTHLAARAACFTPEYFVAALREAVRSLAPSPSVAGSAGGALAAGR